MVVIMIESAEALAEIDKIARVEGVDLWLIGQTNFVHRSELGPVLNTVWSAMVCKGLQTCRNTETTWRRRLSAYPSLTAEFVKMGAR